MPRRLTFNIAMCVLIAALVVWAVASSPVASGGEKGAPKGGQAPKVPSESTDSDGSAARSAPDDGKPADRDPAEAESDDDLQLKPVRKTDREWKRLLSTKEYRVTRQKETELPFSGKYVHTKKEGVYRCVCCGTKLFASDTKFDSGTGWPSFYAPVNRKRIATAADYSDGTPRVEVTCSRCEAHLGHVFGDGPEPTGLRYCINSVALKLEEPPKSASTSKNAPSSTPAGKNPSRNR